LSSKLITSFMQENNLCDLWRMHNPEKRYYTCKQDNRPACSRIDYFLMSFPITHGAYISHSPFVHSDHSIVSLSLPSSMPTSERGPGVWRLNTSILQDKDFQHLTTETLTQFQQCLPLYPSPAECWEDAKLACIEICKQFSQAHTLKRKADLEYLENDIRNIESELASSPTNPHLLHSLSITRSKLAQHIAYKTEGIRIRSRIRWLLEGERPTRYFF